MSLSHFRESEGEKLTSRFPFSAAGSAVRLGLDLAVSTTDLPSVRHDALSQILAVLPGVEISQFLIAKASPLVLFSRFSKADMINPFLLCSTFPR